MEQSDKLQEIITESNDEINKYDKKLNSLNEYENDESLILGNMDTFMDWFRGGVFDEYNINQNLIKIFEKLFEEMRYQEDAFYYNFFKNFINSLNNECKKEIKNIIMNYITNLKEINVKNVKNFEKWKNIADINGSHTKNFK